jgi:hypothetical protein
MSTQSIVGLRVNEIIASVNKGEPLSFFKKRMMAKCDISLRTFRRWMDIANRHLIGQVEVERAIMESVRKEEIAKAAEEGVITDLETQAILSKIITQNLNAKREVMGKEGKVELERSSTPSEIINAIVNLNKMRFLEEREYEEAEKNKNDRRPVIMVATERDKMFAESV